MAGPVDRRLGRETRAASRHLRLAGLLGVLEAVLIVAQAALLGTVIARAALHGVALSALRGELIALGAVLLARAIVRSGFELSGRLGATRVMSELRGRVIERLLIAAPGTTVEGLRTGDLAASAVGGVDALEAYFAGYLPQLILAGIVPVAVLAWTVTLDPVAAGILAATIPVLIGFMILIGKGTQAQTRRRHGALALLSAHFLDVVGGLETLRSFRREAAQSETLARVGERYRQETMRTLRIAFMSALVLELCAMIGTAVVAATIGIELCGGGLSLAAGLTVLLLAPEMYGPLREVGQQFHAGADASAAAERIFAVLDTTAPPAVTSVPSTATVPNPARSPIRLAGVGYSYPGERGPVLDGIDLVLEPGTTMLLRGASGEGKSTIARLLLGFDQPSTGSVRCDGVDLRGVDRERWQERIAWLPQRPTLFTGTVLDNVALGAPDAGEAEVRAALQAMGAERFVASLPAGLNTVLGEGGRRLSAGQRQRIALARAFLRDAPLLILDEPTAHLDATTAADLAPALARLLAGRTALVIVHDDSLNALADRTVILRGGQITDPFAVPAAPVAVELAA
ncbi:MAG TPA: thiol reductant ABC exporter subunit CydD [Solirubrobacteraceae bacterium]